MKKNHKIISFVTVLAVMSGMLCGCTAESADDYYGYINAERLLDTLPEYSEMTWGTFDDGAEVYSEIHSQYPKNSVQKFRFISKTIVIFSKLCYNKTTRYN